MIYNSIDLSCVCNSQPYGARRNYAMCIILQVRTAIIYNSIDLSAVSFFKFAQALLVLQ
jgi:hypothetical protein